MCRWLQRHCSYLRIISMGIISISAINGIYSFIANVSSLQINPKFDSTDGVYCYPPDGSLISSECKNMSIVIAHSTENYCQKYTDYSSKTLYDDFKAIKQLMIMLVIGSIVYGTFAIIHDCTLVYYRDSLNEVRFHVSHEKDFCLSTSSCLSSHDQIQYDPDSCWCDFVTNLVAIPVLILIIIFFVLDIFITMVILPIIDTVLFSLRFVTRNGIYCRMKSGWHATKQHKLPVICYVSSSWVGISRLWMCCICMALLYYAQSGEKEPIHSLNPVICQCECRFVLKESDYWGLTTVTYLFVFVNLLFLRSWNNEVTHLQHYSYLIRYSLPMTIANQINPKDATGNMMQKIHLTVQDNISNADSKQTDDIEKQEHDNSVTHRTIALLNDQADSPLTVSRYHSINAEQLEDDSKETENKQNTLNMRKSLSKKWRMPIYYFISLLSILFAASMVYTIAYLNLYNYNTNIRIALYFGSGIILLCYAVFALYELNTFLKSCANVSFF
eukprot:27881_1